MRRNKVRVAIVGVGNCASSLVQGVEFYRHANRDDFVPGLMHVDLGGYHVGDIEFSAAFDVNARKVGRDLAEAVFAPPNNTYKFSDVARTGVAVRRGPTLDGLGKYLHDLVPEAGGEPVDVARVLRETGTDVVISYLPVGSQRATEFYAEQVLKAGCGFVNCIPAFIASNSAWRKRFEDAKLPIVGDDIKSQVGATITHRMLTHLFRQRGVRLDRTYQLNFGGNTDFLNMLERERLESKKISKRNAVTSQLDYPISDDNAHIGPSDHVPWLLDRKFCYIRMEGTTFGNVPLSCEVKLEVWDSPNSAGVVIDAVRCCKLALDRGVGGALLGPASYFMKSPPMQFSDDEAHARTESFILGADVCRADARDPQQQQPQRPQQQPVANGRRAAKRVGSTSPAQAPAQANGKANGHPNGKLHPDAAPAARRNGTAAATAAGRKSRGTRGAGR
jgi:myo-inositol-1-phosphate synthase